MLNLSVGKSEEVLLKVIQTGSLCRCCYVRSSKKGCEETLLRVIAQMNVPKIIYVSCNNATLARDMKILHELGYTADAVQPVDSVLLAIQCMSRR